MAITDAVCIPAKCGKTSRDFYMMYYKAFDGKWVLTYGKKSYRVLLAAQAMLLL